ncbi:hypothetical protein [Mesomycoplasma ovipneumoniae]|uniref:hypothetical protein n=1 Tax=Mesomycoplasma ovipneumoniae TaxID=29562 RepID=UPI003080FD00
MTVFPNFPVWWDNSKKVYGFGTSLTFLANSGKITIKTKTLNFKSDTQAQKSAY